jgi:hypothetical protein
VDCTAQHGTQQDSFEMAAKRGNDQQLSGLCICISGIFCEFIDLKDKFCEALCQSRDYNLNNSSWSMVEALPRLSHKNALIW